MLHAVLLGSMGFLWQPKTDLHAMESSAATALYHDLNQKRRAHGLQRLELDVHLDDAAVSHVKEMATWNYFAHPSPNGASPFDRLRAAGCDYRFAGENIAMAPDEPIADRALFKSAPHRENILSPNYNRVGIAVMVNAAGDLLFVEDFTD